MAKETINNFIEYSDKVFLLNEHDSEISHDIPFKNQYSGSIKINIEAQSPIFIRNHYVDGDKSYEQKDKDGTVRRISKEFCHHNGIPYIPASSIKGMIRNMVEILSYGKLKNKTLDKYLEDKNINKYSLHRSDKMDLSEAIFGTTEVKGRVSFSHFKSIGTIKKYNEVSEILGTPQPKKGKFGWKNYPLLDTLKKGKGGKNDKVKSYFIPLVKGVQFEGYMRFHNLRDFEIGALISALTFHSKSDCYHNIGLAKSLGYGKISINLEYKHKKEVLQAFEEKLNVEIFNGKMQWHKSDYIKELLKRHSKKDKELTPYSDKKNLNTKLEYYKKEKDKEASKAYNKINNFEDEAELKKFQEEYPNYKTDEIIKKLEDIKKIKKEKERVKEKWDTICNSNKIEDFIEFRNQYPNSFVNEVENKIKDINSIYEKKKKKKEEQKIATKKAISQRKAISNNLLNKIKKR